METANYPTVVINGVACRDYYHTYHDDAPPPHMTLLERRLEVRTRDRKRHQSRSDVCECGLECGYAWEWNILPGTRGACSDACAIREFRRLNWGSAYRRGKPKRCEGCERLFEDTTFAVRSATYRSGYRVCRPHDGMCSTRCMRVVWEHRTHMRRAARWPHLYGLHKRHTEVQKFEAVISFIKNLQKEAREAECLSLSKEALRAARQFLRNGSPEALQSRLKELQQAISTPG